MDDLNNIWNTDDELNEEQLMNYVKGKLNEEDAHTVEKKIADSSFVSDGIEGLQQFSSTEKINTYVQLMNENLHHNLTHKKRKYKGKIIGLSWEIIAVVVIILLCLLSYAIIEMVRK